MSQDVFFDARVVAAAAIVADADISDMTAREFGTPIKVFREVLPGLLPEASACPFVAFGPFTHGQSDKDPHGMVHAMPVGIFISRDRQQFEEESSGVFTLRGMEVLDELAAQVEKVVSSALNGADIPFEQDPYLPDDAAWDGEYLMTFYLYRVRTRRYL